MTANVYPFHSGQPGAPQISAAGAAAQLAAILYACGVTGFGGGVLDSLTQSGGVATATRSGGINLADGLTGMPHIVKVSGTTNGWDGEYTLNAAPGSTSCTFNCPSGLPSPATGTITLVRAPAGMARLASASSKEVYQWKDTTTMPGFLMLDDSNAQYVGIRLAEVAASPVDYSTMTGLCPTVTQQAVPGNYYRKTDGAGGNKPWILVIWKGGMYLCIAWSNTYPTVYEVNYFGASLSNKAGDAYPGIITGASINPAQPGSSNGFPQKNPGSSQAGQYLQRAYNQAGSAIQFLKSGCYFGSAIGSGGLQDPNPSDGTNTIRGPLDIVEGTSATGNLRGQMPLLWDPLNCSSKSTFDLMTNMANLPGRTVLLVKYGTGSGGSSMLGLDITGPAGF